MVIIPEGIYPVIGLEYHLALILRTGLKSLFDAQGLIEMNEVVPGRRHE